MCPYKIIPNLGCYSTGSRDCSAPHTMKGISSESVKRQARTNAKEQAYSDLCIGMSEQMRSERATRLSESIRFECAYYIQIIEVGATPERQWDVPGHGIFSVQQQSASDEAHAFHPPIGSRVNFATAAQPIKSTISQSVKGSVWHCFHFSAKYQQIGALCWTQRAAGIEHEPIFHWMPHQRSAHSNP